MYSLHLRYVYTFYSFNEELDGGAFDEKIEIDNEKRITLYQQEDSSFVLSELKEDFAGKYVILTYPNKDNCIIHEGESVELAYDEYFDSMGDDNHNVYEGVLTLIKNS